MTTVQVLSIVLLVVGFSKLVFAPLAAWFELRLRWSPRRRQELRAGPRPEGPGRGSAHRGGLRYPAGLKVSVIVPAYNEGVVLGPCVDSIAASTFENVEIIVVDDGSTDNTPEIVAELKRRHPTLRDFRQANAGKGAALNLGIREASGDVLLFVDADGLFAPQTIEWMLVPLTDPRVGAVCGDDRPANPDRALTRLLSVLSHVGTGMVRRALSLLHCLPIVSGNIGAFRADLVRSIGGFNEHTLGEDLELTWRVYVAGYRVAFEPRAVVYAESPSTLRGLWRQRVRWSRGLLQTAREHWRLIGNPHYGTFGVFLAVNAFSMILAPIVQLGVLAAFTVLAGGGRVSIGSSTFEVLGWLGLGVSVVLVVFAISLNGAWHDLRYIWTVPLWPIYSIAMGFTMAAALAQEIRRTPARWNKLQRTGVVTGGIRATLVHGAARDGAGAHPAATPRGGGPGVGRAARSFSARSRSSPWGDVWVAGTRPQGPPRPRVRRRVRCRVRALRRRRRRPLPRRWSAPAPGRNRARCRPSRGASRRPVPSTSASRTSSTPTRGGSPSSSAGPRRRTPTRWPSRSAGWTGPSSPGRTARSSRHRTSTTPDGTTSRRRSTRSAATPRGVSAPSCSGSTPCSAAIWACDPSWRGTTRRGCRRTCSRASRRGRTESCPTGSPILPTSWRCATSPMRSTSPS